MQPTFEQALEIINSLPPSDFQKLKEWIEAKQQGQTFEQAQTTEDVRRRRMEWLKANRERYGGQYVVLDGDKLIGVAQTYPEGRKLAEAEGVRDAFVDYLSKPEEEGYWGGWQCLTD